MNTNAANWRRPTRRIGAVALTAVGIVSLAGCTGDSAPILTETPSPTITANATPSPTPSPTLLTDAELLALMPPEAAYPDVRGAIATAEFFLGQYDRAYMSGDLSLWDALSLPDCVFCESVRSTIEAESKVGDYESGGSTTIDTASVVADFYSEDGFTYVTFSYSQAPSTLFHADGTTEPAGDGGTGRISLRMTMEGTVWRISEVGVEEDPR